MKKAGLVLAVCMMFFAGCTSTPQNSSSTAVISNSTTSISGAASAKVNSASAAGSSSSSGIDGVQHTLTLGNFTAKITLPEGIYMQAEETGAEPVGYLLQDTPVVPSTVFSVGDYEMYYGNTLGRFYLEDEAFTNMLRNVGTQGFTLQEDGAGLITETFTYSSALEEYTYCEWEEYIIYHYPTPGVGGPYPHLVFTHLPSGLSLDFHFSGGSVSEAVAYYSDIVSTIQYQ